VRTELAARTWRSLPERLLSTKRIRAQAIILAFCLWGVGIFDFATSGLFDRAGNIKFQDFLPVYISARLIAQHRATELYDSSVQAAELYAIIGKPTRVQIPNVYGPQVGLLFVPLTSFSFPVAAEIWVALSLLLYFACIYVVWSFCLELRPYAGLVAIASVAYPPLFHFLVRGQISALLLACFTAALLAMRAGRPWLAGMALGLLLIKPQFLVAIPLILLFGGGWRIFAGLLVSAAIQLVLVRLYFAAAVVQSYFFLVTHPSRWINSAELSLAPIQMHSLRAFWSLLIPSPSVAFALYGLSSIAVLIMASYTWRSPAPLAFRFSALTFAAVLVNPHLFIHDLLVLAPAFLLLTNWILENAPTVVSPLLKILLYLAFVLPLLGPLSSWTRLQSSVLAFVGLVWVFARATRHLASAESRSV
jgi:arabinofuranan 3-O-arabinosyltransferase